ncbi:RHS repeat-associated core domain-containing protein, partial [Flavobacterium sp.]|uniref:RHS repeat-associated core domain-containing protein n=1 Tax=Flavobacterium sp. TaxID=239 RepID=UPI0038FC0435
RYGFQGQEKDDELKGEGNSLNYTFRMHDSRVGRFFTIDPLTKKYPMLSPYHFGGNNPISLIELEGLEGVSVVNHKTKTVTVLLNIYYAPGTNTDQSGFTKNEVETIQADLTCEVTKQSYTYDVSGTDYSVNFKFNFIETETLTKARELRDANPSESAVLSKSELVSQIKTDKFGLQYTSVTVGSTNRGETRLTTSNNSHTTTHEIFHLLVHNGDKIPLDTYECFDRNNQTDWHDNGKYGDGIFRYTNPTNLSSQNVQQAIEHTKRVEIPADKPLTEEQQNYLNQTKPNEN